MYREVMAPVMDLEVPVGIWEVPVGTWEVPVGTWEVADAMGQSVDRASADTPAKHQTNHTRDLRLQEIESNVPFSPTSVFHVQATNCSAPLKPAL